MVNNTSCIVFGCSKKGIWNRATRKTINRVVNTATEEGSTTANGTAGAATEIRSFFRFPAVNPNAGIQKQNLQKIRRKKWFAAVKRQNVTQKSLKYFRICSRHFISGKPAKLLDTENPDWIPRINMGYETRIESTTKTTARCEREAERERKKGSIMMEEAVMLESDSEVFEESICGVSVGTQTDLDGISIAATELELHRQNERIRALETRIAYLSLQEEAFINEDKKVRHYTGLQSYQLILLLLMHMNSALSTIKVGRLSNFQKLLLVLMKLKMNTSFQGLSYRFDVKLSQVSECFKKVIILMNHAFGAIVHWPDRESLRTVMPDCFKKAFGNSIAVIIDCFEITCQKPSNLKAKAQSYSQYKHNYTVKYLIGITPQGAVSFISNGYGGRASDNFITQDSGLLNHLQFGDVALADRGFTIKEEFSVLYAELKTPEFLSNKRQLPPGAIERTRKIASVRIHVERVIGLVRNKFRILKGPIPINFLKEKYNDKCFTDYIVRVCCILTNLCDSIIPLQKAKCTNSDVAVALNTKQFTTNFDFCT